VGIGRREGRKILPLTGIRIPNRGHPARSQSIYLMCYSDTIIQLVPKRFSGFEATWGKSRVYWLRKILDCEEIVLQSTAISVLVNLQFP
jgi:hypothetical protein